MRTQADLMPHTQAHIGLIQHLAKVKSKAKGYTYRTKPIYLSQQNELTPMRQGMIFIRQGVTHSNQGLTDKRQALIFGTTH